MRVIAHELVATSRTEVGNLIFFAAEFLETEGLFIITSAWWDQESYEKHQASPCVRAFESQKVMEILRALVSSGACRKSGKICRTNNPKKRKITGRLSPAVEFHHDVAIARWGNELDKCRDAGCSPVIDILPFRGNHIFSSSRVGACSYGYRLDTHKGKLDIGFNICGVALTRLSAGLTCR